MTSCLQKACLYSKYTLQMSGPQSNLRLMAALLLRPRGMDNQLRARLTP